MSKHFCQEFPLPPFASTLCFVVSPSYPFTMARRWIIATAAGEALGIAGVSLAYAASGRGLLPEAPAILAAGAWEGACLGSAQALVLARRGVSAPRWIGATVTIAVLGYAGSLAAGTGGGASDAAAPPLPAMFAAAAALGAVLGALMGCVQWAAAGHRIAFRPWLWRSTLGWALAMCAIFAGSAIVTDAWPLAAIALTGAGAGALAGLFLGAVTAPAVPKA